MKKIWILRPGALGDSVLLSPLLRKLELDGFDVFVSGSFPHLEVLKLLFPSFHFLRFDDVRMIKVFTGDFSASDCSLLLGSRPEIIINFLNRDSSLDLVLASLCDQYISMPLVEVGHKSIAQQIYSAFYGDQKMCFDSLFSVVEKKEKSLLMHFGSGSQKKILPKNIVEKLLAELDHVFKGTKRLLLGANDKIYFDIGDEIEILRSENASDLFTILNRHSNYVGFDSGVSHLAGVLGLKGCAFFTTSKKEYWAPVGFIQSVDFSDMQHLDRKWLSSAVL